MLAEGRPQFPYGFFQPFTFPSWFNNFFPVFPGFGANNGTTNGGWQFPTLGTGVFAGAGGGGVSTGGFTTSGGGGSNFVSSGGSSIVSSNGDSSITSFNSNCVNGVCNQNSLLCTNGDCTQT